MANIALTRFGGEIPRMGEELLPDYGAAIAANCYLLSGELRGLRAPQQIHEFIGASVTYTRAFYLPATDAPYNENWIGFEDPTTKFLKSPLVNDAHDRYYIFTDNDTPEMTTRARIESSSANYLLGVPAPDTAATLTPDDSGSGPLETRAYVYTHVTPLGEESAISEPMVATGRTDDSWDLASLDTAIPNAGQRPSGSWKKRIYRTVTGVSGTAAYHFVAEIPQGNSTYSDTTSTDEVALNDTCESIYWAEPPSTLRGVKAHPSGFLVGFTGRDVYFSEPYRPHAWPPQYVISTEHDIVGIGVFGNTVAVMTAGFPYLVSGSRPESMVSVKHNASEPCLTADSIVDMPFGVYYASRNGLQLFDSTGVRNATQFLLTKEEWDNEYDLTTLYAARYNDYYIGFYDNNNGFMFAPSEPNAVFTQLRDIWDIDNIQTDTETGLTIILKDNKVYEWNHTQGEPQLYTWRSKVFTLPRPANFAALRMYSYFLTGQITADDQRVLYNQARFSAGPLDTYGQHALGGVRSYDIAGGSLFENKQPLGGSPMLRLSNVYSMTFSLYADGELVFSESIEDDSMYRLPHGFKATRYQIEITGNAPVTTVKVASTGKELAMI